MKKIFYLLLFIVPLVISSCSKDEEDKNPLYGTKWVCSDSYAAYIYSGTSGATSVEVFEFTSNTDMEHYFSSSKQAKGSLITQKYEYVNDKEVVFINSEGKRTTWYFLSATKLCNKKSESESFATVFHKK